MTAGILLAAGDELRAALATDAEYHARWMAQWRAEMRRKDVAGARFSQVVAALEALARTVRP